MNSYKAKYLIFLLHRFWQNVGLRLIQWLAYSNVFTGLCAISLVLIGYSFLKINLETLSLTDIGVIGLFTTLGYQFPYIINKQTVFATEARTEWYRNHTSAIRQLVAVELTILAVSLFNISFYKILILAAVTIIGLGYYGVLSYPFGNKKWDCRQYPFGKIGSICIVWLLLTIALPVADILHLISSYKILILCFMRLLFIAALCLIFDIRDIKTDLDLRLPTLATKLGFSNARTLVLLLSTFYFLIGIFFWQNIVLALLPLIIFLWILKILHWQKQPRTEVFYLLVVDGAMVIPYLIFIIIHLFYNLIIN